MKVKNINSTWKIVLFVIFTAFLAIIQGCATAEKPSLNEKEIPSDAQKNDKSLKKSTYSKLSGIDVQGNRVIVQSDKKLTHTSVKKLTPSPGVIYYFPDTQLGTVNDITEVDSELIQEIRISQQNINGLYVKLELLLTQDVSYRSRQDGNRLTIQFAKPGEKINFEADAVSLPDIEKTEQVSDKESPVSDKKIKKASSFAIETTPFSRNALVQVQASTTINEFKSSVIPDPPKIVFDLYDVQSPERNMIYTPPDNPFVKDIRTFQYPNRLRMVIDTVPEYISSFRAYKTGNGLSVYVGLDLPAKNTINMLDRPEFTMGMPVIEEKDLHSFSPTAESVHQDVQPSTNEMIELPLDKHSDTPFKENAPIMPESYDSIQPPPISTVMPEPAPMPEPEKLPVQPELEPSMQQTIARTDQPSNLLAPSMSKNQYLAQRYKDFPFTQPSTMLDAYAKLGNKKIYTGEKIAIDFYETDIKNVFRILREVSGQNFAIDSDVSGKVTLTLKKPVPWDQILDLVLKMNKLGITHEHDIIRISRLVTIKKEQEDRIAKIEAEFKAAKKREELLEPVLTHYISVNYARANDLTQHLDKIITKNRGSISVDDRTNTIIISDVKEKVQRAISVVGNLDKPNLQVMIETRIIEVTNNFSRDIGVNWSGSIGIQPGDSSAGIGPQRGYDVLGGTYGYDWAVNYPAVANSNIGINFRRMSGLTPFTLDAQLSAMESKGEIRILTSPRVVALDNREATIEQGLEYPINTLDEKGNTITEFKDVDLDLKVTPHITEDGRVSMLIDTSKNDLGPVVNGKQSFQKKKARTELLVDDGDTVVIGGIMKTLRNESFSGVPLLSRLPLIGWLFSSHKKSDEKEELIIFITPKIIKLKNKSLVKKGSAQR